MVLKRSDENVWTDYFPYQTEKSYPVFLPLSESFSQIGWTGELFPPTSKMLQWRHQSLFLPLHSHLPLSSILTLCDAHYCSSYCKKICTLWLILSSHNPSSEPSRIHFLSHFFVCQISYLLLHGISFLIYVSLSLPLNFSIKL